MWLADNTHPVSDYHAAPGSRRLERSAPHETHADAEAVLDRASFERMVQPLLRGLLARALRLTKNRPDADDLVQETVLRAWRFWPRYIEQDNCRAWLQRILINTFCTERKRAQRLRAHLNELALALPSVSDVALAPDPSAGSQAGGEPRASSPPLTAADGNVGPNADACESLRLDAARSPGTDMFRPQRRARATRAERRADQTRNFDPRDGDRHALDDRMSRALTRLNADQRRVLWLVDVRERSYREAATELSCPIGTVMSRLHRARAALRAQLGAA